MSQRTRREEGEEATHGAAAFGPITPDDRGRIAITLTCAYYVASQKRARVRDATKILRTSSIILAILLAAIATASGFKDIVPVTQHHWWNMAVVGLVGMTAGALAGIRAFAARSSIIDISPQWTHLNQILVKILGGGVAAAIGVLILGGLQFKSGDFSSVLGAAAALGFSEELFTGIVDRKVDRLRVEAAGPSTTPPLELPEG